MAPRRNGKDLSTFAIDVSEKLGKLQERTEESFRRIEGVNESIGKLDLKLDGFHNRLEEHTKEEYGRFDKIEDSIEAVRTSVQTVKEQLENPKISKRNLWAAAGGIVAAVATIITVALYLFDVLAKP